ncbi:NADPH-dependent ferric siderophore reductase, contains FAD-binding and SIP domains [Brevibacterium sp. Mu109]|uniref:siderophore-interacting protein n=1 Tax=Brevibacterium sp. Mu109 TaxID=1255669 RepID=UPI000C443F6F|nr:siderophore-interacting protein [Brevibacterium sp. Mu109]SMX87196.1 NADPH-dependent ferric siderophore reductase, contains FAD-binding and SIP domains [Brevibacterium sp. Mu109]
MTEQAAAKAAPRRRTPQAQHVLTVESTQWLGPHLVRVVAGGESLAEFTDNGSTDAYVKLLFVDPELGLEPPYDVTELRQSLPAEQLPVTRTYTVRWVDRIAKRLAIDFVVHGDSGIAAPWAARAKAGDQLVLAGPGGGYAPDASTDWHLFAGDLSALPAIAASIETLSAAATGITLLEITDHQDIIDIQNPSQVQVQWLINTDLADTGFLARAIDEASWPANADNVQVFAHGERESIKAVRAILAKRGVARESISISGYWARGRTEDIFQAEKREPIGQID